MVASADALISGLTKDYVSTIKPALQIIGIEEGVNRVAGMYLMMTNKDAANAAAVVSNVANAAVIGQVCSQAAASALPVYEAAGIVTISGSASSSFLPALAPTVFNRTIVVSDAVGDAGDIWLTQIATLPSDIVFQQMLNDAMKHQATGPGGQQGHDSDSSATGSHPHTGSSDKPLPGPASDQTRTALPTAS